MAVLSTGYNGFARGVNDTKERLESCRAGNQDIRCPECGHEFKDEAEQSMDEKLCWMVHAEANAVFNAARIGVSLSGSTIYTTKYPCASCASAIAQVGIKRVFTLDAHPWSSDPYDNNGMRVRRIFDEANILFQRPDYGDLSLAS